MLDVSKEETKLWTIGYILLLIVNFLLCFGFYMLPPTLPAYVKQIGGSNLQASLVFGMFSSTSLVTRVVAGNAVDAKGEKTIMLLGMAIVLICTVAFAWLPVDAILLLRSFQGAGWGMATAAIAASVYKIVPENRRGEGSGYYALTTILSSSLTPMVAILLINNYHFTALAIVSAAFSAAGIFLLLINLRRWQLPQQGLRQMNRGIALTGMLERGAILPSFLCFLLSIPLCGIMGFLMLYGKELDMNNIWIFFLGYTAAILLTRPFVGKLFDRKGHVVIILPGSVLMILGLVALSIARSTEMLVLASLMYGLGYGAVQPSLQTWAVNRCPPERKGAANGLFLSSIDLGYMAGSVPLGLIAGITSYASMYRYSAILMVVFLVIYWFFGYKRNILVHSGNHA